MRISDEINGWVESAIEANGMGEAIHHEVIFTVVPVGPGQLSPMLAIVLTMPSANLGERMTNLIMAPGSDHDRDQITDQVKQGLEALRQARTQSLVPSNGHGPVSKLVLPGQ